jgi:hypothetical protein
MMLGRTTFHPDVGREMTSKIFLRTESAPEKNTNPAYPKVAAWWTFPRIIWELGTVVWALLFAPSEKHTHTDSTIIDPPTTLLRDPAKG